MARQLLFDPADAAMVSFGISCQWEAVASLRVVVSGGDHGIHRPWVTATRPLLDDRFALLFDLVGSTARRDYIPDFLTPTPSSLEPRIADELDEVAHTPASVVRTELAHLRDRWTPRLAELHDHPERVNEVAGLFALYWQLALDPWWSRILATLCGEVERRLHRLATTGVGKLLNEVHERVSWDGSRLEVAGTTCVGGNALEGTGVRLIPSVFVWPDVLVVADRRPAQVCFPAYGAGAVWTRREVTQPIATLLGQTKARVLAALTEPMSSPELAEALQLSPASISEHLAALRDAGLVTSHRTGRRLVSIRTDLGSRLVVTDAREP